MQIQGKVFIVTGAASGLGAATAAMLADAGAKVVAADLKPGDDARFTWVKCDVSNEGEAQAAVDAATALGALAGLVNCAGIAPGAKTAGSRGPHPLDLFETVIKVNLVGAFNMIRLAAQAMLGNAPNENGERGVLINTASIAAYEGQVGQAAYAASKGGVVGMTLAVARDLAPSGVRCMTIAPGVFGTPMVLAMPQAVQDSLGAGVPFPSRLGQPDEFARLARFIIENPMLNGETIRLDGALRMQPK